MKLSKLNEKARAYDKVQQQPWNVLGYAVRQHNLKKHLGRNLKILDVGGGNAQEAIDLAKQGHEVHVLEMSQEMLRQASEKLAKLDLKVSLHEGNLESIPQLFKATTFDMVLCHNVLQYVPDIPKALAAISFVLKPQALLSVVCLNKYSECFRQATQQQNIPAALEALNAQSYVTEALGLPVALLSSDDISNPASQTKLKTIAHYGIRCINDYVIDNATKTPKNILDLELELCNRYPYYLLARFFHLILRKES